MNPGVPTQLLDNGFVDSIVVVFDVVTPDTNRIFEILVRDRVGVSLESLDNAIAEPFAEVGRPSEPRIDRLPRRRANDSRNLFVIGRGLVEAALKNDVESSE